MRDFALMLAIAGAAASAFAASPAPYDRTASETAQVQRIPVEELEHMVARGHGRLDAEVARQLAGVALTERLSPGRLEQLRADLPGEKSRQALLVLADASAFLEPPASEIPATATPTLAAQQRMMALTVSYLGKSLPLLPNLFATRDTVRFESKPFPTGSADFADNPLHEVGRSAVTVLYRDNQEFVDAGSKKTSAPEPPDRGLATWGEFGPILGIVMIDAARSRLSWSHWELSPTGPEAVFHYSVTREKSHYDVRFCCVADSYGQPTNILRQRAGYHGQITIDPSNGAILRLTAEADVDIEHLAALLVDVRFSGGKEDLVHDIQGKPPSELIDLDGPLVDLRPEAGRDLVVALLHAGELVVLLLLQRVLGRLQLGDLSVQV